MGHCFEKEPTTQDTYRMLATALGTFVNLLSLRIGPRGTCRLYFADEDVEVR